MSNFSVNKFAKMNQLNQSISVFKMFKWQTLRFVALFELVFMNGVKTGGSVGCSYQLRIS